MRKTDPRRLSLPPKSILKHKLREDDDTFTGQNLTMSQIQFPTHTISKEDILDGNNTTSRISTSLSRGGRRVSFAPDVTLHKFDFVPQSLPTIREPKRKSSLKYDLGREGFREVEDQEQKMESTGESMELTTPLGLHILDPSAEAVATKDSYEPIFDKEVSMDITQLFAKHSARPEHNDGLNLDIDSKQRSTDGRDDMNVEPQLLSENSNRSLRHTEEESMEITDQIKVSQEASMEMTSLFSKHRDAAAEEETMDFTNVLGSVDAQSHQLPSKRRKLSDFAYESPVRSMDKKATIQGQGSDDDLTEMERLSPIPLDQKIIHTELQTNTEVESAEKEGEFALPQHPPVELSQFFESANLNFNIDYEINDCNLIFDSVEKLDGIPTTSIYQAVHSKIPLLEIQAFTMKELRRRILLSKSLLADLKDQLSINAPPGVIKDFFDSSEEEKNEMRKRLQFVASVSRLQSEKAWYEWRLQHLTGIKAVLEENLSMLLEEHAKIMKYMNEINDVKIRITSIKQILSKELELLRNQETLGQKKGEQMKNLLKIVNIKTELKFHMLKLDDIDRLNAEKTQLTTNISVLKEKIAKIQQTVELDKKELKKSNICTSRDLEVQKFILSYCEKICGIKFTKISGSKVHMKLLELKVLAILDFATEIYPSIAEFSIDEKRVTEHEYCFLATLINDIEKNTTGFASIVELQKTLNTLSLVTTEYQRLRTAFNTKITTTDHDNTQQKLIVLELMDRKSHCKIILSLSVEQFIGLVCNSKKTLLHADIVYGNNASVKNVTNSFILKNSKCFSWLTNCIISL